MLAALAPHAKLITVTLLVAIVLLYMGWPERRR